MRVNGLNQSVVERAEDGDKEKKKKRRQNRRSKQNPSASANGVHVASSECQLNIRSSNLSSPSLCDSSSKQHESEVNSLNEIGLTKASEVAFSSMPTMHFDEPLDSRTLENQLLSPANLGEESVESVIDEDSIASPGQQNGVASQRKYFAQHWPMEAVLEALQKGDAYKALFRVNAHNRLEAYCRIDGVKTDILINGIAAQNRAVDGDIVAIKVDPLSLWTRMKGSGGPVNSSGPAEAYKLSPEGTGKVGDRCKGKNKVDADYDDVPALSLQNVSCYENATVSVETNLEVVGAMGSCQANGHKHSDPHPLFEASVDEQNTVLTALAAVVSAFPSKRPTGRVVAVIEKSHRRDAVIGFLNFRNWVQYREAYRRNLKNNSLLSGLNDMYIELLPTDPKFQKMRVPGKGLPDSMKKRLEDGDATVEMELVAAQIDCWPEESLVPQAHVMHIFGRGGEIDPNIAAILFENGVCCSEFTQESLSSLPHVPWVVPPEEYASRRDLRELCVFTIDPSTATDLDDALSVEKLPNGYRVGVHIADASYFVQPNTALDLEAKSRFTSVYMLQRKLPMLPSVLSENLGSLIPGVDRLAFSIFFDINLAGDVKDRWVGRTVVQSCCKLSYKHAQDIIDGTLGAKNSHTSESGFPRLHGRFDWLNITQSVKLLAEIAKILRKNRFNIGALSLESAKVVFSYDENGVPYDSMFCEQEESNFLVEEFMLLANTTAAEIISRVFPDSALLRRHPEPDLRKLREFAAFCSKHGLELDTSSGQLHHSLVQIREKLKDDTVLFDILISYALKPMQLATYFCSGFVKEKENDWSHYALAVPVYTHFTSPLRRYTDILVHRMLAAAIEAEDIYLKNKKSFTELKKCGGMSRCFTGIEFDNDASQSLEGRGALSAAALKHGVPCTELLAEIAAHCNKRSLASRRVKDACDKLCMWYLLKNKENLFSEARVLGLGPRFMSIYIQKLAIERRIYYDDVEGLMIEWLDATSTLVLSYYKSRRFQKRCSVGKYRGIDDVAWIINPCSSKCDTNLAEGGDSGDSATQVTATSECHGPEAITSYGSPDAIDPAFLPLTVRLLSTIPVAIYAVGGNDGPIDIRARLYVGSYFG